MQMRRQSRDASIHSPTQLEWETRCTLIVDGSQRLESGLNAVKKVDASPAFLAVNGLFKISNVQFVRSVTLTLLDHALNVGKLDVNLQGMGSVW